MELSPFGLMVALAHGWVLTVSVSPGTSLTRPSLVVRWNFWWPGAPEVFRDSWEGTGMLRRENVYRARGIVTPL